MPNRRALVVAINDYGGNGSNNLPSCINDANGFTNEVLKNPSFAFDQIHTLLDADATVAKVQSELDWLVKDAKSDDRLVFYFSGHGYTQLVDGVMEEFLVLREAGGPALFADNLFVDKVKNLPEGVFTAVIDSCFSGGKFKLFTLAGAVEVAQTKTLPFPPEAAQPKAFTLEPVAGSETNKRIPLRGYRRWGCATRPPLAASKVFSLGDAGGRESALGSERSAAAGGQRPPGFGLPGNGDCRRIDLGYARYVRLHVRAARDDETSAEWCVGRNRLQRDRGAAEVDEFPPDAYAPRAGTARRSEGPDLPPDDVHAGEGLYDA